jgi:hypothetical protein
MNTNSELFHFLQENASFSSRVIFYTVLVWICIRAPVIELELLAMAKIAFVCASRLMLESYFGTINSGSKNDLSTHQHSVEIRKKMHICCAAAKILFTASTQHSTALQPETCSEWWAQGICTYVA